MTKVSDLLADLSDYDETYPVRIRMECDGIEYTAEISEVGFRNRAVVLYTDVDTVEETND